VRYFRIAATAALVIGLVLADARAGPTSIELASSTTCSPTALSEAFGGPLKLQSIDKFGCAGDWAFIWATVGISTQEVGVTDVVRFSPSASRWSIVSRLKWCKPALLPELVYRQGCFSN
jgi:hypothetical protein